MGRNVDQRLARALQVEHEVSYMTALNLVRNKLAELRAQGVAPREAQDRVAVMTREELGLR